MSNKVQRKCGIETMLFEKSTAAAAGQAESGDSARDFLREKLLRLAVERASHAEKDRDEAVEIDPHAAWRHVAMHVDIKTVAPHLPAQAELSWSPGSHGDAGIASEPAQEPAPAPGIGEETCSHGGAHSRVPSRHERRNGALPGATERKQHAMPRVSGTDDASSGPEAHCRETRHAIRGDAETATGHREVSRMAMTSCTTASAGAAVAMGFWPMTGGPALKAGGAMGSDRVERDSLDGEANDTAGVTVRRGESTDAVRLVRRTGRYGCHFDRRPEALARGAVQSRRVASGVADTARGGDAYAPDAGPAAGAARRPSISVPDSTGSASPGACGAYGDWPATPWRLYFTFRSWEHKPVIELSSTPGIFTPNARPAVLTVHVTTVDRAALRAIKGALARGDADADAELAIVAVEA